MSETVPPLQENPTFTNFIDTNLRDSEKIVVDKDGRDFTIEVKGSKFVIEDVQEIVTAPEEKTGSYVVLESEDKRLCIFPGRSKNHLHFSGEGFIVDRDLEEEVIGKIRKPLLNIYQEVWER